MQLLRRDTLFLPTLLAIAALAWLALVYWNAAFHGHAAVATRISALSRTATLLSGWALMTVAMMLPASVPLFARFRRVTRRDGVGLVVALIAGYLLAWLLFGIVVAAGESALRLAGSASTSLAEIGVLVPVAVLGGAGIYQLTDRKGCVLARFHSPVCFIAAYWEPAGGSPGAAVLGLRYGGYCVRSCGGLMLAVAALGHGLGWMLLLGAVMVVEKNAPWGRELRVPIGIALLSGAAALASLHPLG